MSASHYDYIIAGAGCAGLSLAVHLLRSEHLRTKKVLIIDRANKSENDRTWCFWEKQPNLFQGIVYKEYTQLLFKNKSFSNRLQIDPYVYKMIRGIDFYQYCLALIDASPNITFLQCDIEEIVASEPAAVIAGNNKYTAEFIFNSIFTIPDLKPKEYWLLQHFKGWLIKTDDPAFNPDAATLMDFTTDQRNGTAFFYILPFSENEALVEYTLFSKASLKNHQYDDALKSYINNNLGILKYQVMSHEEGIIPMTNHRFSRGKNNITNIGTAGGQTKGSSGYTFRFIQQHSASIVAALEQGRHPLNVQSSKTRHQFYDSVLLNILYHNAVAGERIFSDLFRKNSANKVLEFLDNDSGFIDELNIISSLPIVPFAKAAVRQLLP